MATGPKSITRRMMIVAGGRLAMFGAFCATVGSTIVAACGGDDSTGDDDGPDGDDSPDGDGYGSGYDAGVDGDGDGYGYGYGYDRRR